MANSNGFVVLSKVGATKLASGSTIEVCIGSTDGGPPAMYARRVRGNGSPAYGPVVMHFGSPQEIAATVDLYLKAAEKLASLAKPAKPAKPAKGRKAA